MGSRILRCLTYPTPKPKIYILLGLSQSRPLTFNQHLTEDRLGYRASDIVDTGRGEVLLVVWAVHGHVFC